MADTYTLHLENFRSIRDATVDIAPLTVICGICSPISHADVLVTTDVPLFESLAESGLVTCRMRDDFLSDY